MKKIIFILSFVFFSSVSYSQSVGDIKEIYDLIKGAADKINSATQTARELKELARILDVILCQMNDMDYELQFGVRNDCYFKVNYEMNMHLFKVNKELLQATISLKALNKVLSAEDQANEESKIRQLTKDLQESVDETFALIEKLRFNNLLHLVESYDKMDTDKQIKRNTQRYKW